MDGFEVGALGWRAGPVGEAERGELERLFVECEEFVRLTEGRVPSSAQVDELLRELPPGRAREDKHVLGIRGPDGALIGVVDLVSGYPAEREWFLGLMLLAPAARGGGAGGRVYAAMERAVRDRGATALWLAVLEQNEPARRFWGRAGFTAVDTRRIRLGDLDSVAVRMVRRLDGYRRG